LEFDLGFEAVEELLEDILGDFFENFFVDFSLVLHRLLLIMFDTNLQYPHTLSWEIRDR
jgi:hypothetical protein